MEQKEGGDFGTKEEYKWPLTVQVSFP